MLLRTALAIAALAALPAAAAETPWQEVAPGVRLRLISTDVRLPDDTTLIGIEIDMPENTKTYWRVPGESGIVTEIDTAGSTGIAGHEILWPYPAVEITNGYLDYVYHGPTVLPVTLVLGGDAPVLEARITMGVCSDVCVPAMAEFTLLLDFGQPDAAQKIRLAQAEAETPLDWTASSDPFVGVGFDAERDAITLTLTDPAIDPGSLIADMGVSGPLFGTPQKSPEPGVVLLPLLGSSEPGSWEGQLLQLTFLTSGGPYETTARIGPPVSTAPAP